MKKWEKPILKNVGVEQTEELVLHYFCLNCWDDLGTDYNAKCPKQECKESAKGTVGKYVNGLES